MDKKIETFQAALLRSVMDMKAGRAARATQIEPTTQQDAEEAAIQRGIDNDYDAAEIPTENIKAMRPFSELLKEKGIGQPPSGRAQEELTIEYDADVLEAFRANGDGWQERMNDALRTYLKEHPLDAD